MGSVNNVGSAVCTFQSFQAPVEAFGESGAGAEQTAKSSQ